MNAVSRRALLFLICVTLPLPAAAMEGGRAIAGVSLAAKQQNALPPAPWLGAMRVTDNDDAIYLADGEQLMRYGIARAYNNVPRDVSPFYKTDSPQVNFTMHFAGRKAGEIISLGVDSGYRAKKITMQPALFLGYARSIKFARASYVTVAAGGWFGGNVSHKPCRDELGRNYYCKNLTAWSDFRPQKNSLNHYYHFVFTHEF